MTARHSSETAPWDGCRRFDPYHRVRCGHLEAAHERADGSCSLCLCSGPYLPNYTPAVLILLGVAAAIALVVYLVNTGVIR